jgi:hypothetical protein
MPTTHRNRLLDVGAVLTAVLSLGAILGVAACGPPPPPPSVLPGDPHFTGRQAISEIFGVGGGTVTCSLILDTEWDLYYEAAVVNAKTSPAPGSWCPREDFYNVRAVASCSIGSPPHGLDCGAAWAVPVGNVFAGASFAFGPTVPPNHGHLAVDFSATLVLPSGLTFSLSDHGETPPILCNSELRQCKFQT